GPVTLLNRLSTVVAETEMHRLLDTRGVQYAIDRFGGKRAVGRIAGNVGLVHLHAGATQIAHLRRERIGDGQGELGEIVIVFVEQGSGEHVGTGERELDWSARNARRAGTVFRQVQDAFGDRPGDDRG